MRPIFRWGSLPKALVRLHQMFRPRFLDPDASANEYAEHAEIWDCSNENELLDHMKTHPLMYDVSPDFLIQMILDKSTSRWFIVGLGLHDRITIGDIDAETGEVIPGTYTKTPMMLFCQTTEGWVRLYEKSRIQRLEATAKLNPWGLDPMLFSLIMEGIAHKRERVQKEGVQFGAGKSTGTKKAN